MNRKVFTSIKINNLKVKFLDSVNIDDSVTDEQCIEWFEAFMKDEILTKSHPLFGVSFKNCKLSFDYIIINGVAYTQEEYTKHYLNGNISIISDINSN